MLWMASMPSQSSEQEKILCECPCSFVLGPREDDCRSSRCLGVLESGSQGRKSRWWAVGGVSWLRRRVIPHSWKRAAPALGWLGGGHLVQPGCLSQATAGICWDRGAECGGRGCWLMFPPGKFKLLKHVLPRGAGEVHSCRVQGRWQSSSSYLTLETISANTDSDPTLSVQEETLPGDGRSPLLL